MCAHTRRAHPGHENGKGATWEGKEKNKREMRDRLGRKQVGMIRVHDVCIPPSSHHEIHCFAQQMFVPSESKLRVPFLVF